MSKSATASAQKTTTQLPSRSAWSRGPPQNTTAPSPRSQSPAPPAHPPQNPTHARRPSALGQAVPIKDGVSISRGNVGALKQGSAVTFGSIDDLSAPISSSPAPAPSIKAEVVKSFGTVPAAPASANGKPSLSSKSSLAPSPSSSTPPPATSPTPPSKLDRRDVSKLFQNPPSAPSSQPPSDTASPAHRPSSLPPQTPSQPAQAPSSSQPSQLGQHTYTPFVPSGARPPQQNPVPGGGPPRSPVYPRQMANGSGSRPQAGPNAGPSQISSAMSSPRLAPHPHTQPSGMPPPSGIPPQMQPQMQQQAVPGWPGYYYSGVPGVDQQPYYMQPYNPWGHMQQMPMPQHPPHHPPGAPHGPPHTGMPMSPRSQPSTLPPGTPTQPHAVPSHIPHQPSHAPSTSISGVSSPPPTPSTATNRLSATSSTFVPSASKSSRITLKTADGNEVDVGALAKSSNNGSSSPVPRTAGPRQSTPQPRRPSSIRLETPEQQRKRLEDVEKGKAEAKAKADVEAEERRAKDRKAREEEELQKRRVEEEEKARVEAERLKKEEAEKERLRLEEEQKERVRKEQEEKERAEKEEEERKRKEAQDKEKEEKRLAEEKERQRQEEEAEKERLRLEAEASAAAAKEEEERAAEAAAAAAVAKTEPEPEVVSAEVEEGEIKETEEPEDIALAEEAKDRKEPLRINTTASSPLADPQRRRPDPLDLSGVKRENIPAPLPSALLTARNIEDLDAVSYPEGISSPKPELNKNAEKGKFRYDRDFLLQFMKICNEKPVNMPPLDAIGLEPLSEQAAHAMSRGGSGRHGRNASGALPPSRQASVGLGINSGSGKFGNTPFGMMGNFAPASKLTSEERFASSRSTSVSGAGLPFGGRPSPMQRTASQGGPGGVPLSSNRTRSKRGEKRGEHKTGQQPSAFGPGGSGINQAGMLEPVAPLQVSANRWDRKTVASIDPDSPEVVDRKVKGLLNKLTMEKFDSISDQIIAWANKSEKEKDGRTLIQVIRLVFEKATDEATWSEMYARLCRKMMERISPQVQDDGIKNTDGKPITGGQLFRKYLLNRCQEDFERGWVAKEAAAAAAASKAKEDQAIKDANEKTKETGEIVLYSEEYYIAQKAKRQGLGLIKFIGELFKLQMLTERIMHECVKKLLGNVENPEEEEIESLCKLLTTVGQSLDTIKARAHMDVYFSRMKELTKSQNVSSRMQFMLQDVIELRERKWITRNAVAAPTTIAQIHENAAKEKAAAEKEAYQRQISMSRGGSRRGGDRGDNAQQNADGWAVAGNGAPRAPPKAGDLSNFGKINKSTAMTFGPSSVFAGKRENKRDSLSLSRTSSSSNMFSMLQSSEPAAEAAKAPEVPAQRKRLVLQPRSKPTADEQAQESSAAKSESESEEEVAPADMTEAEAETKIKEDLKEFFAVRNLDEAEVYFTALPAVHHLRLVDKLTSSAVESKEADAQLVADLFSRAVSKELVTSAAFEEGLTPTAEIVEDIAIDAPKAWTLFATIVKAVGFDEERRTSLASKSTDSERLLALLS